jgi:hypothetical protein
MVVCVANALLKYPDMRVENWTLAIELDDSKMTAAHQTKYDQMHAKVGTVKSRLKIELMTFMGLGLGVELEGESKQTESYWLKLQLYSTRLLLFHHQLFSQWKERVLISTTLLLEEDQRCETGVYVSKDRFLLGRI